MIIVGAPVHQRGWILDDWFRYLSEQTIGPERLHIVLNYGPSTDGTLDLIQRAQQQWGFGCVSTVVDKGVDHRADRRWNESRYVTMVRLRNRLLDFVRAQSPSLYLSLDTDILLPSTAVENLVDGLSAPYQAIAPLTHMTPTGSCPNAFDLDGQRLRLSQVNKGVHRVFAVFGAVLMTPQMVSRVSYVVHRQGEDIGWATEAWRQHQAMAINLDVRAKHVMDEQMLGHIDERIGF